MIAQTAETWIGTPFQWQASIKGVGADCKGLIAGVARECGRPEAGSLHALAGDYGARVPVPRLKTGLAEIFDRVAEVEPGDVLLLIVGGKPQHLAIAAPIEGQPSRTIQALHCGPCKVVAIRQNRASIHSIWRWRDYARS
jgi:cell wall-associated NlpC family hydrolase